MASTTETAKEEIAGLPVPQRYWAIVTIGFAIAVAVLDGAIANIALPTIAHDLHASAVDSIWVVNAYQLAVTISLLPLASLGEIWGYRRIYLLGLVAFTLASLGCALSHSLIELTAARVIQGFGASGVMSVNTALIRFIYPRAQLGRGIGINAMVVAVSSAVGPTVASAILSVADWQWLFAINLPIGAAAVVIGLRALPNMAGTGRRFDLVSALLCAVAFGLLITAIDGLGHRLAPRLVAAEFAGAILFGFLLVRRQLGLPSPLLPVDLLRIPVFALSVATSVSSFTAQMLAYVSLPFYLQDTLGRGVVETGLLMTPWPIATGVMAPLAGRLSDRLSAGLLGAIGLAALAAGLALLATLPARPESLDIAWRMALCGAGFGLFQSPNNRTLITSAPKERSGGASGMLGTARLLGQTTGAALVALIFGLAPTQGTMIALAVATCCAVLAALVSGSRVAAAQPAG